MRTTFDTSTIPEASDVVMMVINADDAYAQLYLREDSVVNYPDLPAPYIAYPVSPGAFHEYRMIADMTSYQLYVDGQFAFSDVFHGWSWTPGTKVVFGDSYIGAASVSEWDYIDVAVVPEAANGCVLLAGVILAGARRR
jgi:hypothetical protein